MKNIFSNARENYTMNARVHSFTHFWFIRLMCLSDLSELRFRNVNGRIGASIYFQSSTLKKCCLSRYCIVSLVSSYLCYCIIYINTIKPNLIHSQLHGLYKWDQWYFKGDSLDSYYWKSLSEQCFMQWETPAWNHIPSASQQGSFLKWRHSTPLMRYKPNSDEGQVFWGQLPLGHGLKGVGKTLLNRNIEQHGTTVLQSRGWQTDRQMEKRRTKLCNNNYITSSHQLP